ncbi:MAG: ATP-binding response regulator [Anaerolineae bacterium]
MVGLPATGRSQGYAGEADGPPRANAFSLDALLQPTQRRLALFCLLAGYAWSLAVIAIRHPAQDWNALLAPALLIIGATVVLKWRTTGTRPAPVLVASLTLAALLELALGRWLLGQWLTLAAAVFAGVLLGPPGATAVAAVITFLSAFVLPLPQLAPVAGNAWFAALLAWLAGHDIAQALTHAEDSESRAWRQAMEAMRRRGELQSTSKTMREMYALLERTNGELEAARREAEEAREVKARFAANISHELRTPLNLIMGFSRMMYRAPEVYGNVRWTPELRADIREIHAASHHLLGMIDDILDLARVDAQRLPLKLDSTDLADLIREAASTARGLLRGSSVALSVLVPEGLAPVVVDRTRIRQVLLNLLSNAIRFTDAGAITVSAAEHDGEIEVAVADTGVGIPADDLPTVFDEFAQARGPITSGRGGAGLGLAVCKQFVQMHGGRITVNSEVGRGSVFHFSVPIPGGGRARSRLAYYSPGSAPLPGSHVAKAVVALAASEASARLLARGVEGYRVVPVAGLEELAEVVEAEHPAGVILMRGDDSTGPSAGDVWQVTGRSDLGVIEWQVPAEDAARRYLDVDAFLTKPVDVEQMITLLRGDEGVSSVLVTDDAPGFRALVERAVTLAFPRARVRQTDSAQSALAALRETHFDAIVLDLAMPGLDGVGLLRLARQEGLLAGTRILVATGATNTDELPGVLSPSLHFSKKSLPRGMEWLRSIKALLDSAAPDYSLPRGGPTDPAAHPATPAS